MASSPPPGSDVPAGGNSVSRKLKFLENAKKNKHSFIQFSVVTGILLLSFRSLGQKYQIHDLQLDTAALKEERDALTDRMNHIKSSLFREASLDSSGSFASRLRLLFGSDDK